MNKSFFKIIIPILSFGLSGCGGSDDGTPEGNLPSEDASQEVVINAQDTVKFAALNTQTVVDLRQRVKAENSEPLLISDVKKINGDCDILSVDGLSFNIYARDADVCMFEYSVTPASDNYTGNANAVAQVVANTNPEQGGFLPPFSRTMVKNGETKFVSSNLITEAGYVLDVDSLVLLNSSGTNDIGEVLTKSESGFTYKAPDSETIVRIYYSAINKTDNIVKPGTIYIAVGQNSNTNPIAQNKLLPPKAFVNGASVIKIDKSWLHDEEGDELQLVYVKGDIGSAKINGDLQFNYKPFSNGSENIAYVVTDHNGGYGVGVLSFDIESYEPVYTSWGNIFHPPMTLYDPQLASSSGMQFESGENGLQNNYPTFSHSLALAYCQTQGLRLPTPQELEKMWTNDLGKESIYTAKNNKYKWHSSKNYLTQDPNQQVSLKTGKIIESKVPGYFSCIESTIPIEWEFATKFLNMEIGHEEQVFIIHKDPETGNITYRNPEEYDLEIKVNRYTVEGLDGPTQPGVQAVKTTINNNTIKFETPFGSKLPQYINATVTDKNVPGSIEVNVGLIQCADEVGPAEALQRSCIGTVRGLNKSRRWTMAIPISQLRGPTPQNMEVEYFVENGKGYVGSTEPNKQEWHDYIKPTCDMMNSMKVDGRSNWAAGLPDIPGGNVTVDVVSDEDRERTVKWVVYMQEMGSTEQPLGVYGQGYAGMPGDKNVVNQDGVKREFEGQEQGYRYMGGPKTYTFASCVSEN